MSYHKIAIPDELSVGEIKCVTAGGRSMLLARTEKEYYALDNKCPHLGGQLCDGRLKLDRGEVVCGLHNWDFDLETGVSAYNPENRLETFNVDIRDDGIYVEVSEPDKSVQSADYLGPWRRREDEVEDRMDMVQHMADGWVGPHGYTEPMRTARQEPLWDKVVFLPGQLANPPLLDDEAVNLETTLGKGAEKPIKISMPVYVSHMSFGALSREAKIALAKGSAMAGTLICSGEGGMLGAERDAAKTYILEMASGYFGWTEEAMARADGVEIKIGQAAKAGMGGMLPARKVTEEIAAVRKLGKGEDAISPSRFRDISSVAQMKQRVAEIRSIIEGKPLGIKIAAARVEEDVAAALECEPDYITIDGRGGATGAAPKHVKDNICAPTLYALSRAVRFLDSEGAKVDLVITGGLRMPADFAKAIAMGATAVACATSAMIAIGCQQYRACHTGNCPVGIATQNEKYRKRLDVETSANMLAKYFELTKSQLTDFARICGKRDISELSLDDLATTSEEIALYTDIYHVGQFR